MSQTGRLRRVSGLPLVASLVALFVGQATPVGAENTPQGARAGGYWVPTGSPLLPITEHTATLLPDGTVLVAGGDNSHPNDVELYDPAVGAWGFTGTMDAGRFLHTATLLRDGKV